MDLQKRTDRDLLENIYKNTGLLVNSGTSNIVQGAINRTHKAVFSIEKNFSNLFYQFIFLFIGTILGFTLSRGDYDIFLISFFIFILILLLVFIVVKFKKNKLLNNPNYKTLYKLREKAQNLEEEFI